MDCKNRGGGNVMLIKNWMSVDVVTVVGETPVMKTASILKKHKIRRLPVVDSAGKLIGIVTDFDIKEATPSTATSLDIYELHYLLSKVKTSEVMTPDPVCVKPDETVELAAALMLENKISGLPVIENGDHVAGIITESDIFRALIKISRVNESGKQFAVELDDVPGSLKEIADDIREAGGLLAILTTHYPTQNETTRKVYIRIHPATEETVEKIKEKLSKKYKLLYVTDDAPGAIKGRKKKNKHYGNL